MCTKDEDLKARTQIDRGGLKTGAHNLLNRQAQRSEVNSEKLCIAVREEQLSTYLKSTVRN